MQGVQVCHIRLGRRHCGGAAAGDVRWPRRGMAGVAGWRGL